VIERGFYAEDWKNRRSEWDVGNRRVQYFLYIDRTRGTVSEFVINDAIEEEIFTIVGY
jgi:hypothetical protein